MASKLLIGKEEWCALPEFNVPVTKARVDTGAQTSSLHAVNISAFDVNGQQHVQFDLHPIQGNRRIVRSCTAPVVGKRIVKSSTGEKEKRFVIKTPLKMGEQTWDIEVTLTNRDSMGYRMLLGREAMRDRVLIDPDQSFLMGVIVDEDAAGQYETPVALKGGLKIGVLANNPELYSNRRIMEAGEDLGHEMSFIDVRQCYLGVLPEGPQVRYRGVEVLDEFDAIIPRIRPSMTFYAGAILRQFEACGIYCQNTADAISRSRDKLRALQKLAQDGLPVPRTGFANSPVETAAIIKLVGGAPLIIKLLEGTQGKGVVMAETNKAAESVINAFKSLQANILVQEFIKEAGGRDVRCFVVGGKVIASMQRQAAKGEFRANLHLGGTASAIKITAEERKVAIAAVKSLGLEVGGVDIIRSADGPRILEVNSSPGLEGVEAISGENIAGKMIESIERKLKWKRA